MPKPKPKSKSKKIYMTLLIIAVLGGSIFISLYDPFNKPYIDKLSRVAESGEAEASWCLYLYYFEKEESKADYWLRRAASLGYPRAQYLWYVKLIGGSSAEKKKEGFGYLSKSAEKNYPLAEAELGNAYFFGSMVSRDYSRSEYWYRRAALKGVDYTMLPLAQLLAEQKKDFGSLVEAYSWSIIGYNRSDSSKLSDEQKRLPETILSKAGTAGFHEKKIRQASEKLIGIIENKIASYHYPYEPDDFSADQCKAKVK